MQVATNVGLAQVGHALAPEPEHAPVLCACWDPERQTASIRCGHSDFSAQQERWKRCRHAGTKLVAVALKARIRANQRHQVEVARWTAGPTGGALACDAHA